jgi:hypothetical protein
MQSQPQATCRQPKVETCPQVGPALLVCPNSGPKLRPDESAGSIAGANGLALPVRASPCVVVCAVCVFCDLASRVVGTLDSAARAHTVLELTGSWGTHPPPPEAAKRLRARTVPQALLGQLNSWIAPLTDSGQTQNWRCSARSHTLESIRTRPPHLDSCSIWIQTC